ncbi:DUF4275 family protein [Bacillus salipaludis]|uniref:DUF4275 family protein n=1 Tax=Bacillus salipaludis TaxID=2547811 RepID=A0AA90TU27_9BACI|nr:DUF4275 family protein [Bacillus salipaludis]MDQ6600705.1 DUF4275 family protein [Bacillus salipaludis]
MKNKELKIVEIPKWGHYLRQKWRESFASHLSKEEQKSIGLDHFLWNLCSGEKVKCLEKEKAIKAFENQTKNKCTIFYQFTDEAYLVQNAKTLTVKDLPYKENYLDYSDIYIMDWDNKWTFIITHETDLGLGPYFIQKS